MITYRDQDIDDETCPKRLGKKQWENIFRYTRNVYISDIEFIDCAFSTGLTTYGAAVNRSSATNIFVTNCRGASFFGTGAIFDEVVVDGIRTSRAPVTLFACALRHVVLKGNCGSFIFNSNICHDDDERNKAYTAANTEFYRNVDWALDISELKSSGFELRGCIPVELIRRNPSEQFIMTRDVAINGDWRQHDPFGSFQVAVDLFLKSGSELELFVAARRSKRYKEEIAFYNRLKDAALVR